MLDRRQFVLRSVAMAAVARSSRALGPAADSSTVVKAPCGTLRGESADGVRVFRGVPFAQPPVGPLRFRPPQVMAPWSGVREATKFSAAAVQPDKATLAQSEDCLYLNLWAPETREPLPVFVWVHGGGFTGGHSFEPLFDGSEFARNGVICITVAYRLGALGFLNVAPLLGSTYEGSANNGLRDIMAALHWVQTNVGAFGGDPKRVTIGGESAGAKLTDLLMGVPSAQSLFRQNISESGGADRIWDRTRSESVGRDFGTQWTASKERTLAQLLDAPAREIIDAEQRFIRAYPVHFPFRAQVDGALIKQSPLETIRQGSTRGKRLLLGTNRDESALFLGPHPSADPTARDLGNLTIDQFGTIEARYPQIYPAMTEEMRRIRSVTAEEYWVPSIRVADAHVAGGGSAFVYRLDFSEPTGRFAGLAFHSYELRFVWDHFGYQDVAPGLREFARTVHAAWVSFIQGKAPQAEGLPVWPPYSTGKRPTMLLDRVSRVEDAPQAQELSAWDGQLMH